MKEVLLRSRLVAFFGFLFVFAAPGLAAPALALPSGRVHAGAPRQAPVPAARLAERRPARLVLRSLPPRGTRLPELPASLPGRIHCVWLPLLR